MAGGGPYPSRDTILYLATSAAPPYPTTGLLAALALPPGPDTATRGPCTASRDRRHSGSFQQCQATPSPSPRPRHSPCAGGHYSTNSYLTTLPMRPAISAPTAATSVHHNGERKNGGAPARHSVPTHPTQGRARRHRLRHTGARRSLLSPSTPANSSAGGTSRPPSAPPTGDLAIRPEPVAAASHYLGVCALR